MPFIFYADIDECSLAQHTCDSNANCINTKGSFNCTCSNGFEGNGSYCKGKSVMPRLIDNLSSGLEVLKQLPKL